MIHITGDSHWLYNAILYGIIYWFTKEKTFLHHNIQEMFKVRRKRIQSMIFQLITTTKFSFFTIIPFNSLRKAVFSKLMHTKKRKEKKKKTFSHLLSTNFFIRMGKKSEFFSADSSVFLFCSRLPNSFTGNKSCQSHHHHHWRFVFWSVISFFSLFFGPLSYSHLSCSLIQFKKRIE